MFLLEVVEALEKAHIPFAIAGGYAVALHGAVRGTVDVDIVLRLTRSHFLAAESALKGLGLAPRLPVSAAELGLSSRRIIGPDAPYQSECGLVVSVLRH